MIGCEQFIYALYNKHGYQLTKSVGLNKLLSNQRIQYLCHIGDGAEEECIVQLWFPSEQLLTVSNVHPVVDEYHRKGIWNHTIVVKFTDYLALTQPSSFLAPYFIKGLKEPPGMLPVLQVE